MEIAPLILCVRAITEVQEVTYTQNDVCMKELTRGTLFGATIAVMMYGAQAEETYIEKSMWFSPWVDQIKSAEFHTLACCLVSVKTLYSTSSGKWSI